MDRELEPCAAPFLAIARTQAEYATCVLKAKRSDAADIRRWHKWQAISRAADSPSGVTRLGANIKFGSTRTVGGSFTGDLPVSRETYRQRLKTNNYAYYRGLQLASTPAPKRLSQGYHKSQCDGTPYHESRGIFPSENGCAGTAHAGGTDGRHSISSTPAYKVRTCGSRPGKMSGPSAKVTATTTVALSFRGTSRIASIRALITAATSLRGASLL